MKAHAAAELNLTALHVSALRRLREWFIDHQRTGTDLSYKRAVDAINAELKRRKGK